MVWKNQSNIFHIFFFILGVAGYTCPRTQEELTAQIGQLQWGTELPESRTDSEKETSNGVISKEFWPFFWYGSKAEDDINPK